MSNLHLKIKMSRPVFEMNLDLQVPGLGITAIFGPSG